MKPEMITRLNAINTRFYSDTAPYFDSSRSYDWNGWNKILKLLPAKKVLSVLDIGCGNGRFYSFLKKHSNSVISYTGIDLSLELLEKAREKYPEAHFLLKDLLDLDFLTDTYDVIVLFGVMHHIPSYRKRQSLLEYVRKYTNPGGVVVLTFWDFMNDDTWKNKNVAWKSVGIDESELEKHDYLLPWERGVKAFRYCHFFDEDEITSLLQNFQIKDYFYDDGKSGRLNKYYSIV